jgi:predicted enzyme related to lactoylglutathione lyase
LQRDGVIDLVDYPGCFGWYELMTTDRAAAQTFYGHVLGWEVQDASTPNLPYSLFTAATAPVCGLMDLPEEGRRMGARPRWMAYVVVDDVEATTDRIKRLGGAVFVPPTGTNIGRISVVADPQTAIFAVVSGLKVDRQEPAQSGKPGRVGWHELLAADGGKAFGFYSEIFDWQKPNTEISQEHVYRPFSACGLTIGGMFTRHPTDPPPFWLLYFNVDDIEAAEERVKAAGGQAFPNPVEMPGGMSIARCADPQGTVFALQGRLGQTSKLGWSTEWSGFSSKGRLVGQKPRGQR